MTISQAQLKEILSYDPETGVFRWKKRTSRCLQVGWIAGGLVLGYVSISIYGKAYKAHRLAWLYMTGELPSKAIDHINGIRSDNRFVNLREASIGENLLNKTVRCDNKSRVKGVHWDAVNRNWRARVKIHGKNVLDKRFPTLDEADAAARQARNEVHGVFSRH